MKKLVIANCLLSIAVIFTYCAKPDLKEELSSVNTSDASSSRGICTLTNLPPFNTATLTFCGTNTNTTSCIGCPPANAAAQGVEVQAASAVNLTLQTKIIFSVSTNKPTTVNFSTGVNSTGQIQIPANGCKRFAIDDNCVITAL